ncbi:MAG TPA: hypothetical protein VF915_02140 [Reyranella sp.]
MRTPDARAETNGSVTIARHLTSLCALSHRCRWRACEAIALVRDYAGTGDNERLKALAAEVLAAPQSHLDPITRRR